MIKAKLFLGIMGFIFLVICLASCASAPSAAGVTGTAKGPLRIATTSLAAGAVGSPYSGQLQATGGKGNYVWSVVGGALPSGLALSSSGAFSGKPAQAGTFSFTVQVVDTKTLAKARVQIQLRG